MRSLRARKTKPEADEDNLPANLDPKNLRFVGFGLESLHKYAAAKRKMVELDPDVAREFNSADQVNEALRLVKRLREIGKLKRRKSA